MPQRLLDQSDNSTVTLNALLHLEHIRSGDAFSSLADTILIPISASSGNTFPHRINHGSNHRSNRILRLTVIRMRLIHRGVLTFPS